jgi:hypothetical protein
VEACVEVPAVPEAGVVVVEVSLGMLALFVGDGGRNILR